MFKVFQNYIRNIICLFFAIATGFFNFMSLNYYIPSETVSCDRVDIVYIVREKNMKKFANYLEKNYKVIKNDLLTVNGHYIITLRHTKNYNLQIWYMSTFVRKGGLDEDYLEEILLCQYYPSIVSATINKILTCQKTESGTIGCTYANGSYTFSFSRHNFNFDIIFKKNGMICENSELQNMITQYNTLIHKNIVGVLSKIKILYDPHEIDKHVVEEYVIKTDGLPFDEYFDPADPLVVYCNSFTNPTNIYYYDTDYHNAFRNLFNIF
jgi:hypothetical protein